MDHSERWGKRFGPYKSIQTSHIISYIIYTKKHSHPGLTFSIYIYIDCYEHHPNLFSKVLAPTKVRFHLALGQPLLFYFYFDHRRLVNHNFHLVYENVLVAGMTNRHSSIKNDQCILQHEPHLSRPCLLPVGIHQHCRHLILASGGPCLLHKVRHIELRILVVSHHSTNALFGCFFQALLKGLIYTSMIVKEHLKVA